MITDVPGVRVGHWTGDVTGVTVIVFPPDTTASCEIRGGAPATRETALLEPGRTVQHIDAIVLSGGSAFGLVTADGVMRALAELGRGFPTRGGPVPLVPAAAIFDLVAFRRRPARYRGRSRRARRGDGRATGPLQIGPVGAGRGATVGKWRGGEYSVPGGLGSASARATATSWSARSVVVNAVGDLFDQDGRMIVGSSAPEGTLGFPEVRPFEEETNTTLAVVATNARCTKLECRLLAESAHHGLVRAIHPSHTRHDGDIAFAAATGQVDANFDRLRLMATEVTAEAVRSAVT